MTKLLRAEHLSWRQLGEHTIILDSRINQEVHHLNEVGSFLWEYCDGTLTEEGLCLKLIESFDVDENTAKIDVCEFVKKLNDKSLLSQG